MHVRAKIDTMVGHVEHDELYRVILDNGRWLIDALEVVNEDIEAKLNLLSYNTHSVLIYPTPHPDTGF